MEYRTLTPSDPDYPKKAKERLGAEAPVIYYHGNLGLLNRVCMSVLCSDESHGRELMETNDILFTIREYSVNYIGSWHSVIESEIFRLGLFKGYGSARYRPKKQPLLGEKTVTLFSAKGLKHESYESYLLDRFYPPLHQFPERDEYFRQAEAGELLMLSVADPDDPRQSRKNIMARNWIVCTLGDIVFIPYGPKGTKTYTTAKKAVEAKIPLFTIDHSTSADLHRLGIPGFNRKTVRAFFEERGAKLGTKETRPLNLTPEYLTPESPAPAVKEPTEPAQTTMNFNAEKNDAFVKSPKPPS